MDNRQRLQKAIQDRDKLRDDLAKAQGRLESARAQLLSVENECRQRKVDPNDLEALIAKLELRLSDSLKGLEERIQRANQQLTTFTSEGK